MKKMCLFGLSSNLGGTEIYMITIVRELKNNVRFDYLIQHDCAKISFKGEIVSLGGKAYREYYYNSERNRSDYTSPKNIISNHPEWDRIYLNLQRIHTAYRLIMEAKKVRRPYRIIHAYNNNYTAHIGLKDKLYEYFQMTKRMRVTQYLACSKNSGVWMFGKGIDVTPIPNAVDFNKIQMNDFIRNQMQRKCSIADDTIVLGFCRRLCYQKKIGFLIEIINELKTNPHYKLLIVGDGDLKEYVRTRAIGHSVDDKVIFARATNNVMDYYQMMDCFVFPSRFEGFEIVLLKAQASEIKCYTTDKTVLYKTNITGRMTFIPQDVSAEVWVKKIETGGFDRIDCLPELEKSDYSLDSMCQKLLNVFDLAAFDNWRINSTLWINPHFEYCEVVA